MSFMDKMQEEEIETEETAEEEANLEEFIVTTDSISQKEILTQEINSFSNPAPVFKSDGIHTYVDALLMLQRARSNDLRVTFHSPRKPLANGQVYLYALQEGQNPYDWRMDGLQWHNLRANTYPKKSADPTITRHEFRLLDSGRKVDFFKHEYHEAGQKFKTQIELSGWKYPFIVIYYYGNYPVNEAKIASHGNRKINVGDKRRRLDSSQLSLKRKRSKLNSGTNNGSEDLEDGDPLNQALESISGGDYTNHFQNDNGDEGDIVVLEDGELPSSSTNQTKGDTQGRETFNKDGSNFRRTPNSHKAQLWNGSHIPPLTKDDLFGCYAFKESTGDKVLRMLDFSSGCNIVIAEDNLVKHVNCILNSEGILQEAVRFTYQPTVKLFRFCISTLFITHPIFENEPQIPIAVYLHRTHSKDSHSKFFKNVKELIPGLNTECVQLTLNTEQGVVSAAREEFPGNPNIKTLPLTSPRISSPKLDFVLAPVARSPNCDHVKVIHLVYFLQCYFMNEITRSLLGNCEGDLLIQSVFDAITCAVPSLADRLLPGGLEAGLQDAIPPPELISMLTKNPPVVKGTGSDYEVCSRNELQLFEGLANFFLMKDRVQWLKDLASFSVRGLGGVEYAVKLNTRTCSCLRGKACEHVLAILIGTGILARHSQ